MAARRSLEPFLTDFGRQDPAAAYAVAGSFVAFLLDSRGIESMKAFIRGCGTSPSRYEQAFGRAYGRSVASLTIEWMAHLSRGERSPSRAWYDAAHWPATLTRGTASTDLAEALNERLPPTPRRAEPRAAEVGPAAR
jgi:hypothetical protein